MGREECARLLQAAWNFAQEVRQQTSVVVELRLTTLGLTAVAADAICSRTATVSWNELERADDLPALLTRAIRQAAERPRMAVRAVAALQEPVILL